MKTTVMVCEELSYLEIRIEKSYGIISPFAIFLQMRGLKSTCTCKNNKILPVVLVSSIWNKLKKEAHYCNTFYNSTFGCHSMNAGRYTCRLSGWNALSEILSLRPILDIYGKQSSVVKIFGELSPPLW